MIDQAIQPFALFHACVSMVCFTAYALDKRAARTGRRRTPERTLLLLGLVGGWPGAFIAQRWLRHKSSKRAFQVKFWFTVMLHIVLVGAMIVASRV